jgi:hypothetical protein
MRDGFKKGGNKRGAASEASLEAGFLGFGVWDFPYGEEVQ